MSCKCTKLPSIFHRSKSSGPNVLAKKGLVLPSVPSSNDRYGLLFRNSPIQVPRQRNARLSAVRYRLRPCRHIRRMPQAGVPERGHHARFVRRYRHGLLPRRRSDRRRAAFRRRLGAGHRGDVLRKAYPRRLGHRTDLVARHGFGHHLHISDPGLRTEPYELSVRQHPERHVGRSALDGGRSTRRSSPVSLCFTGRFSTWLSTETTPGAKTCRPGS